MTEHITTMLDTTERQLALLRAAAQVYDHEFAACARSPEWKAGALRGLRLAAGLKPEGSPYKGGSAQDDAWRDGCEAGMSEWRWREQRGQLPGQPGWRDAL